MLEAPEQTLPRTVEDVFNTLSQANEIYIDLPSTPFFGMGGLVVRIGGEYRHFEPPILRSVRWALVSGYLRAEYMSEGGVERGLKIRVISPEDSYVVPQYMYEKVKNYDKRSGEEVKVIAEEIQPSFRPQPDRENLMLRLAKKPLRSF